jgi:hypothetical protein
MTKKQLKTVSGHLLSERLQALHEMFYTINRNYLHAFTAGDSIYQQIEREIGQIKAELELRESVAASRYFASDRNVF